MLPAYLIGFGSGLVLVAALAVVLVVRRRREVADSSESFRCRVRVVHGWLPGVAHHWPRRTVYATWVHDVLLVQSGPGGLGTRPLAVRFPEGNVERLSPDDVKGLGTHPVGLRLRLDEGAVVEVAAASAARYRLAGPYAVAALVGSGRGPADMPPPGR